MNRTHLSVLASVLALACGGTSPSAPPGASPPPTNQAPPGTPPPALVDPTPPPAGGSGSNRFQIGAALGLYLVDPAKGEPTVQGLVNVTYGPTGTGNFIPPDGTDVTLNGVPLLRDPALNGSYWRLDPAGPQPAIGSGGELVLVASVTVAGQQDVRTLVLPCPADVVVTSTPSIGSALVPVTPPAALLHLASTADLTLNVGIAPIASIFPQATLYGYEPATRSLVASGSPTNIPPGPLDMSLAVLATAAPAYLLDLRWPGSWVIDGQTGGFCGLAKRWTYAK